jgi:hypothetical protein
MERVVLDMQVQEMGNQRARLRLAKAVPLCYTHTCQHNLNVT